MSGTFAIDLALLSDGPSQIVAISAMNTAETQYDLAMLWLTRQVMKFDKPISEE